MKRKKAKGGEIPLGGRTGDRQFILSPGHAIVSDDAMAKYGREYFEALNGGETIVQSASEYMAEFDDEG